MILLKFLDTFLSKKYNYKKVINVMILLITFLPIYGASKQSILYYFNKFVKLTLLINILFRLIF